MEAREQLELFAPEADRRRRELTAAVRHLDRHGDEAERGAVYTRRAVVEALLDLSGYERGRALHGMRLLEPSFGEGDFLLPAVERLMASYLAAGGTPGSAAADLAGCVRAVEIHGPTVARARAALGDRLRAHGLSEGAVTALLDAWLVHDDFLLAPVDGPFDVVVGNPPYVRLERISRALMAEYRRRYRTIYDRADLYIPFYERCLDPGDGSGSSAPTGGSRTATAARSAPRSPAATTCGSTSTWRASTRSAPRSWRTPR